MPQRKKAPKKVPASAPDDPKIDASAVRFPIVGVGASSGGLEAIVDLLQALPDNPGMAFVVIQHQQRDRNSFLSDILRKTTKMPLEEVVDDVVVEPNHVYVAPPNAQLLMDEGTLRITPHATPRSMPIDRFFDSLATSSGKRAVAVVLSGTQSDGTLGATAIRDAGGVTFAQDESAKFRAMPSGAAAAGVIDFVLPPAGIAAGLTRIGDESRIAQSASPTDRTDLEQIYEELKRRHYVDFAQYKPTTIERRIHRRMTDRRTESLSAYLNLIREDAGELDRLYADLLIHVTNFFRDAEAFDVLAKKVIPQLLEDCRTTKRPIRIWVPGCATGQEVYSIAIALFEAAGDGGLTCPVQIFGTDISDAAIHTARAGFYFEDAMADVSEERLERFFVPARNGYRIHQSIRECCIFSRQDVTRDPPFSNLDLVSCRNVLIYLGPSLQRKAMAIFHYALRPNGFLMLGSSESIGSYEEVFATVDRRNKLYQKRAGSRPPDVEFEPRDVTAAAAPAMKTPTNNEPPLQGDIFREADRVVLSRHAPAGVVIDDQFDILQFRGRTSGFLEPAPGVATLNLLKMLREGLLAEVRAALAAAQKSDKPVRRDGVRIRKDGDTIVFDIEVLPFLTASLARHYVVLFDEKPAEVAKGKRGKKAPKEDSKDIVRLRRELDATREYLQSIIEEQEAMNEELRSSNEEIQSSNEELQSTNEELQTAKEELQSTNEELHTLNEELDKRNMVLTEVNNDLVNVLTSIEIPVVMVDRNQKMRRFNPAAERSLGIIPGDVGRSINDLKWSLLVKNLEREIADVIKTLKTHEVELQDGSSKPRLLRIRPYKTIDDRIDGAVLTLFERDV